MNSVSSPNSRICITDMGIISSLGLDVDNACAAARAGLTRITELKCLNFGLAVGFGKETYEGFPVVVGHTVPSIASGFVGMAKVLLLGSAVLKDLWAKRHFSAEEFDRTGIHINLSDWFIQDVFASKLSQTLREGEKKPEVLHRPSQQWKKETSEIIPKILARSGILIPLGNQAIYYDGHAGIVHAVQDALTKIRKGMIDRCIVAGIDSCVEPHFLQAATALGLLKTNENPFGFIPGEAGGFFLLERINDAKNAGVNCLSVITGIAMAQDAINQFSDDPPTGRVLEQVVREVVAKDSADREFPSLVVGDLNGNERRAMDWGHALVRLHNYYPIGDLPLWLPAVSFGETGAATGVLSVCLAVKGFDRGYAPGNTALVWLSSDNGNRGTIVLQGFPDSI